MEKLHRYAESVQSIAHREYLQVEGELSQAVHELTACTDQAGYDAVPQELISRITRLQHESGMKLKDWLDTLDLT